MAAGPHSHLSGSLLPDTGQALQALQEPEGVTLAAARNYRGGKREAVCPENPQGRETAGTASTPPALPLAGLGAQAGRLAL